jgi:uncharacterized protein YndB with AHSA1/START domain
MKQTVGNDTAVVFECDLPEPRDKVWRALTERELLAAWLMPNDIRPEVGAKFQLRPPADSNMPCERAVARAPVECEAPTARGDAAAVPPLPIECEVLKADPGRLFRWRQLEPADAVSSRHFVESVVSFELSDAPDGGTHLRVVHDGFITVTRCSTVVAFRPRAKAAIAPTSAVGPIAMCCSLRRAA